ncbi:MAG: hydroxymethylbilane synthase, partial [Pseudanabaena sp. ELA748]
MVASSTVRISSRKSQLALVQTHWVQAELSKAHPNHQFDVVTM